MKSKVSQFRKFRTSLDSIGFPASPITNCKSFFAFESCGPIKSKDAPNEYT
eukprot:Pgem_evm1s14690